jgi:hypothetical protein
MSNTMSVDLPKFSRLQNEYQNAVKNSQEIFIFDGNELLTSYAKYLIEYLTPMFQK